MSHGGLGADRLTKHLERRRGDKRDTAWHTGDPSPNAMSSAADGLQHLRQSNAIMLLP